MSAISQQIWSIDPNFDIDLMTDQEILDRFWVEFPEPAKTDVHNLVNVMEDQGKTTRSARVLLVDKPSRKMARVRQFTAMADAEFYVDWCLQNFPTTVPTQVPVEFTRDIHTAVDNYTLQQFIDNWPNY